MLLLCIQGMGQTVHGNIADINNISLACVNIVLINGNGSTFM